MIFRNALLVVGCMLVLVLGACGNDVSLNNSGGQAVIEAHLQPSQKCALSVTSPIVPRGSFDISRGGWDGSTMCDSGYSLNLLVNNRTGGTVVFNQAEVALKTASGESIVFNRDKKNVVPNPLKALLAAPVNGKSLGLVTVQAIPPVYAHQLDAFKDATLTVEVILHGQALTGEQITSRPFAFPVDLCLGCMTMCYQKDIIGDNLDLMTVYGTDCQDNAGADDRVCVDTGC